MPVQIVFSVSGPNGQPAAPRHDNQLRWVGSQAGTDTLTAFADNNSNGTRDAGEPEQTAIKRWLATQPNIALTPPTASNEVGTSHTVTATVTDGVGPVAGVNVRFTLAGPNSFSRCLESIDFYGWWVVTNASGQATCTYTGSVTGTDTITAYADTNNDVTQNNNESSQTADKTWNPSTQTSLTLTPAVAANLVATNHCVDATGFISGTAAPSIVFSVSGANPQPRTPVAGGGRATYCWMGAQAGNDIVTAFADGNGNSEPDAGEPQRTATKRWLANQPTLTLTPATASNQIGTSHTVTATVTDGTGPVAGVSVYFSAVSGPHEGALACTERVYDPFRGYYYVRTDANGRATCTYTGQTSGQDTIKALADTNNDAVDNNGEASRTATKSWTTTEIATLTLNPTVAANFVNTTHCVDTRSRAAGGTFVPSASIVWSVTGANTRPATRVATNGGLQPLCWVGTQAGIDTFTVFADNNANGQRDAGEPQETATKRWLANQPTLTLTPATASNQIGTSHTVTATVTDGTGPVAGVSVYFSAVSGPHEGALACTERVYDPFRGYYYVRTDANGRATCTYTGQTSGQDTIKALADTNNDAVDNNGEASRTATKSWTTTEIATLTLNPTVAANFVSTTHCVDTRSRAAGGTFVPSASIVWSVTGANTRPATRVATNGGLQPLCWVGTQAGIDTFTVFADNNANGQRDAGEPQETATKRWLGTQPNILLSPPTATNPRNEPHTVTATVTDGTGPVAGVSVYFSAVSGPNEGALPCAERVYDPFRGYYYVRTNANGEAHCTYTSTQNGTDSIKALADTNNDAVENNGETSATAEKIWVAPQAPSR